MSEDRNPFADLSEALAAAAERGGRSTVLVDGRRRIPATGVVWDASGLVVTADHVLERDDDITVSLPDGSSVAATVAGRDPGSDVAVLRLADAGSLTAGETAPDASGRVGSLVLALGRPSAAGVEASLGAVSAQGGPWRTFRGGQVGGYLRSDVTFFPGFSGGPLVDAAGRVVGMNSSRLGRGAGLTIPSAALAPIVQALAERGRVSRGYLGIGSQTVPLPSSLREKLEGQESGLLIVSVEPESPAERGGLLIGDVLARFAEVPVDGTDALQGQLGPASVGTTVTLTVLRGGEPAQVSVTVGER